MREHDLLELGEARRDEVHVLVAAREVDARLAGAVDEAALARVQTSPTRRETSVARGARA